MAREAGLGDLLADGVIHNDELERFAALVAAAEREACARVCEQMDTSGDPVQGWLLYCAAGIRARGET